MAAVLDEHHIEGKAFGNILDGTGYRLDGNIWGFEIFYGDCSEYERIAHLYYTPVQEVKSVSVSHGGIQWQC